MILAAASLLLLAATITVWFVAQAARAPSRVQLRFAGVLFAAIAAAILAIPGIAAAVTLMVLPIGLGALALAVSFSYARALPPALGALALALASLCGLGAAATGLAAISLAPAALATLAIAALFVGQFDAHRAASVQGMLSALALLGAISTFALEGVGVAFCLFLAAAMLGVTLALSRSDVRVEEVDEVRDLRGPHTIGPRR